MSGNKKNTWCSKADILKDLAQVTGRLGDVDESYIVVGGRPPPPRKFEDDDEMKYRFRDCETLRDNEDIAPDLNGITQMLRMINELDNPFGDGSGDTARVAPPDEVVTISKLNPNVAEFIPNGASTSSPSNKMCNLENKVESKLSKSPINNGSKDISKKVLVCNENDDNPKDCKSDTVIDINKRIDVSKLNPEEIRDITKQLRSKISDATKKDNLQGKREKNVAIAALLKLYSATPSRPQSPAPEEDNKPILFTPKYFESSANATVQLKQDDTLHENRIRADIIPSEKNEIFTGISDNTATASSDNLDVVTDRSKDPSPSISSLKKSPVENKFYEDPDIRESIKKVNKWFETPKPRKPKGPAVFLGPISFKRKDNPKSPISDVDSTISRAPENSNIATNVAHYKPSKYAENLSKMYMERSKENERLSQDIWTRVENELKAKEKKMKEQSETVAEVDSPAENTGDNSPSANAAES